MSSKGPSVLVVVPARNEASRIGPMLASLGQALTSFGVERDAAAAELSVVVVAQGCDDGTADVAAAAIVGWGHGVGARVVACDDGGGKVAAIRAGLASGPARVDVLVVVDADIIVAADSVRAVVDAIVGDDGVVVASAPQRPLPPRRHTPLAWALHRYNASRGFAALRQWFNGRLYATRRWDFPGDADVRARAQAIGDDDDGPLLADDVWLSRVAISAGGAGALVVVGAEPVLYRAPETLSGMCQHLRRLRREVGRVNRLFPELPRPPPEGPPQLQGALDGVAWTIFRLALGLCRAWLVAEDRLWGGSPTHDAWPRVAESKAP